MLVSCSVTPSNGCCITIRYLEVELPEKISKHILQKLDIFYEENFSYIDEPFILPD